MSPVAKTGASVRCLTHQDIDEAARGAAERIARATKHDDHFTDIKVYPVPRGGVPAAYKIAQYLPTLALVDDPSKARVFVDDIVDSGATRARFAKEFPGRPFVALFEEKPAEWVVFPWEGTAEGSAGDVVTRFLQFIGEDPSRGGLKETPARVVKAWGEWFGGYKINPRDVIKAFDDGAGNVDEMVVVRDIPMYSHCEHHVAPFFGVAHIGYVPQGKIVGLSKLARLVDIFAHRLQVQERLTNQIADAMMDCLGPLGVGVVLSCRHMCMESRGIRRPGAMTVTSALRGVMRTVGEARSEFLSLVRNGHT